MRDVGHLAEQVWCEIQSAKKDVEALVAKKRQLELLHSRAAAYDQGVVFPLEAERDALKSRVEDLEAERGALMSRVKDLEDLEAQSPRWRPVSEEPEKEGGTYLVMTTTGCICLDDHSPFAGSVTHWMPIPAPPATPDAGEVADGEVSHAE